MMYPDRWSHIMALTSYTDIAVQDIRRAMDPRTSPKTLKKFHKRNNEYLNVLLTQNPKCPVSILRSFSKTKKNFNILEGVAQNRNTPISVKKKLLQIVIKKARRGRSIDTIEYKSIVLHLLEHIKNKEIKVTGADLYLLVPIYKVNATNLEILEEVMMLQGGKLKKRNPQ